jgi:hypothetical protein
MLTASRVSSRRNFRSYVDISKFTGMEVEHKHDTSNAYPHSGEGHIHLEANKKFERGINAELKEVRSQAL